MVNPAPVSYEEGREDTFWLTDIGKIETYTRKATLRLVSSHAYWYVEEGHDVSQSDLESAAAVFEDTIRPKLTAVFGTEWTPGVDNDPHITILHARLRGGVAGYFSAIDEYPSSVHQYSNEREVIYMGDSEVVASSQYLAILAHEFQHAIHWYADDTEETWITEGLAEVAAKVAGYSPSFQSYFIVSPTISLVNWPLGGSSRPHYGGANLFIDYLVTHYGTLDDLKLLIQEPLDEIAGINAYLAGLGHVQTFRDVFKDWTIANYLDVPGDGPYSYPDNDIKVQVSARISDFGQRQTSIPPYSAEYSAIDILEGDVVVRFEGQRENSLLPVSLNGGRCWWSNRGDSISSTLTRPLDLSQVSGATLRYRVWFATEESWDYGYVEVSTDGGSTWDILQAPATSPRNPVGNSFGHGYTGNSNGWIQEVVDLAPYVGKPVLLRFHYVTDEGVNGTGLCFDDIAVPEVGYLDSGQGDDGWQAEGFVSIDNRVRQDYIVQIIEVGDPIRIREMALDEDNKGELVIRDLGNLEVAVVVVAALTPKTLQNAVSTITVGPAP